MKIPRLEDLILFVRTADLGSLSAAARDVNISPAVASAAVKRLEFALGARLFVRSTRSLRLTPDGERYMGHARDIVRSVEEGADSLARDRQLIGGTLNLSVPSDLGRNLLLPWLDAFQAQYPAIRLQLRISDRVADLYRQPVEVALRYGPLENSGLVALPLVPDNRRFLCAAPAYFEKFGQPKTLSDLRNHNCLRFMLADALYDRWIFQQGKTSHSVAVDGDRSSDDGDTVRRWAVAGVGLAYKSRLDIWQDLQAGRLLPAVLDYEGEMAPLNLVCAHRLMLSPALVALRGFLQQQFSAMRAP